MKWNYLTLILKLFSLCAVSLLVACTNTKPAAKSYYEQPDMNFSRNANHINQVSSLVLSNASQYMGTPYQWGGTSKKGIDCSGLVYLAFSEAGIKLPRVARLQAEAGTTIPKNKVKVGDLIFFHTHSRSHAISHVGIVEKVQKNKLFFIHASSSEGVMISSSQNSYWKPRIVKFVRVINN